MCCGTSANVWTVYHCWKPIRGGSVRFARCSRKCPCYRNELKGSRRRVGGVVEARKGGKGDFVRFYSPHEVRAVVAASIARRFYWYA